MAQFARSFVSAIVIFATMIAHGVLAQSLSLQLNPLISNFTQKADHAPGATSETFQQRYQLVTDYYKEGGPILFVQSAEAPLIPLQYNIFLDWAEELGAIVATLEHRFFGTSYPEGFNFANPTAKDYAGLTLNNVLKDSVAFVQ